MKADKTEISRAILATLSLTRGHLLLLSNLWDHVVLATARRAQREDFEAALGDLTASGHIKSVPGELPGEEDRWVLGEAGEVWAVKNRPR